MKTIRTILLTLAGVFLCYGLLALISLSTEAAIVERTLYQIFTRTNIIALVIGGAALLIGIILLIAQYAFKDEDAESEADDLLSGNDDDDDFDKDGDDDIVAIPVESVKRPSRSARSIRPPTPEPVEETEIPDLFRVDEPAIEPVFEEPIAKAEDFFHRPTEMEAENKPKVEESEQRFCIFCGSKIGKTNMFCPFCGKKL
ncbi:MAG: hypothetical protein Q4C01_05240 [Clostridia bacterium]|nr:hypothetical protein [Clostridia bacterium]